MNATYSSNSDNESEDGWKLAIARNMDLGSRSEYEDDEDAYDVAIQLGKAGEKGSGYHTKNDPSAPYQRQTVIERRGIMEIRCRSLAVIHGGLQPGSDKQATLLVYDVSLDTVRKSRRITWVQIEFKFASSEGGRSPEVFSIAPAGRVGLLPSSQDESVRKLGSVTAGASELFGNVGATLEWEKTVSRTSSDSARVVGNTLCDDLGRQVGASWILEENKAIKSGVPSLLRCAMVVSRTNNGQFECDVTIRAKADWKTELGRLVALKTPGDDPILFDPDAAPTNRLSRESFYDVNNLASTDVNDLVDIRYQTLFSP